jgi:hypothetical protein
MGALADTARSRGRLTGPTWLRAGVIAGVLVLCFVVARSCQQSQVRLTKEQAIATAEKQVDFEPARVQIRLLRQGIGSEPFWIVSLSVPGARENTFKHMTFVRIDANTGKVADVQSRTRPD